MRTARRSTTRPGRSSPRPPGRWCPQGNLMDYADVSAGEALLTLGSSTINENIMSKAEGYRRGPEEAGRRPEGPGRLQCRLPHRRLGHLLHPHPRRRGEERRHRGHHLQYHHMVVDITVDDRNIAFVQARPDGGAERLERNTFIGTVTQPSTWGAAERPERHDQLPPSP